MMRVVEHASGHVTLLFSIYSDNEDLLYQGSRGAGFCVKAGVECQITARDPVDSEGFNLSISVHTPEGPLDSEESAFLYVDVFEEFLSRDLLDEGKEYLVDVMLELPTSQGFGMSAAGALACAQALSRLSESSIDPATIAHIIERRNSSGLGDVLAASVGGVELRLQPGAPPAPGKAVSFPIEREVILCWDPEANRHTSTYIDDANWQKSISAAGEDSLSRLSVGEWNESRWSELLDEADCFAKNAGMLEEKRRNELLQKIKNLLPSGFRALSCMLGTSVCIVAEESTQELDGIDKILADNEISCIRTSIQ